MSKRIFHHYEKLEEYHAGMWKRVSGARRNDHIANAADLMKQPDAFRDAMMRAVEEWPLSCEANLTAEAVNRLAWLGHAGCCIAVQSPEDCTRSAWHTLEPFEQDVANQMADEVLTVYLRRHRPSSTRDLFDMVTS